MKMEKELQSQIQMEGGLNFCDNLQTVYPEVKGELCNKHMRLLSKLKKEFGDLYEDLEPQSYVLVNGVAKVLQLGTDLGVSLALENGITVLYCKTYKNDSIFVNGNHIEEELIFNQFGKHLEGLHQKNKQMEALFRGVRKSAKISDSFGAILYVHSNIPENSLCYEECFMLAILLSALLVYDQVGKFSKRDIIKLLAHTEPKLSKKTIQGLLYGYEVNRLLVDNKREEQQYSEEGHQKAQSDKSIRTHDSNASILSHNQKNREAQSSSSESISSFQENGGLIRRRTNINIQETIKLILCKLDVSNQQNGFYQMKKEKLRNNYEALQKQKTLKNEFFDQGQDSTRKKDLSPLEIDSLYYYDENKALFNKLIHYQIPFSQYLRLKNSIDFKVGLYDQEVAELILELKRQVLSLRDLCVIDGHFLMISLARNKYAEAMCLIRQLLNNNRFSTAKFLQSQGKMQARFQASFEVGEIIFTSSPSAGYAIYTPNQDLWI